MYDELIFREAELADYERYNKLYITCSYLGDPKFPKNPVNLQSFEKSVAEKSILLAELNGEVIGYLEYSAFATNNILNIKEIFVANEWQNKGVGRRWINFLEQQAVKDGILYFELISANAETDKVWESLGFHSIGFSDKYRRVIG